MKKYLNKFFFTVAAATVFFSACKKEETKIYYNGGSNPVLTSSLSDSITLVAVDSLSNAISFSWTNPNYQFTDGISSQDVNYYMEFDTLGANFSSQNMQQVSIGASALDTTFTVGAINSILANGLGLTLGQQHNIQVRLESFLGTGSSGATALYSNVFNYVVTPYAPPPKVTPPYTGALYIVGDAGSDVPAFTNWTNSAPGTGQQFTQISPTEYQITINMAGGSPTDNPSGGAKNDEFLFVPKIGDWSNKYQAPNNASEASGGSFIYNGSATTGNGNFYGATVAGTYLIDVNFQTGVYTITKQ